MKIVLCSFFLILTLQISEAKKSTAHPFYVSIIQIDHNLETRSLEITFKIFTDDLEKSIVKESDVNLYLTTTREDKRADTLLSNYIKRHFQLEVDSEARKYDYIGFESALDVTRIYVEITEVASDLNLIEINSDLLISETPDQSNIFHYEKQGDIKSLVLNRSKTSGKIVIK